MHRVATVVTTALLVMSLTGCYGVRYNASGLPDDAVSMTSVSSGVEGRHFVTKRRAGYLLWGLLPLGRTDLGQVIQEQAGGRRVVNLQIQSEVTALDGALWLGGSTAIAAGLSLLGLGFLGPLVSTAVVPSFQTLTIEGDLIQDATSSLRP